MQFTVYARIDATPVGYIGGRLRHLPLICLILTIAGGQETQTPASNVPPAYRPPIARESDDDGTAPPSPAKVAIDAPVLTIRGLCDPAALSTAKPTCQTVITRAQFEQLADAILTNMKPSMKRELAQSYPNLLAMAHEAETRGLEKTARFQQRLAFARVQILSQELIRQIDNESAQVSEQDIEVYYHAHIGVFEQATLERIFIPSRKRMVPLAKEKATPEALNAQRKNAEEAMTKIADELRTRAIGGEEFVKLQREAYAAAGAAGDTPNTSFGQLRRTALPPAQAVAFDLKPGEISEVLTDSTGHYIYKLDAKDTAPLERVKDEIRKTLQNQHREEAIKAVQGPIITEINESYFGPSPSHRSPQGLTSK
jgi:hypothetical protein